MLRYGLDLNRGVSRELIKFIRRIFAKVVLHVFLNVCLKLHGFKSYSCLKLISAILV